MTAKIRILGIDPGIVRTGWGVIDHAGSHLQWVAHGVVAPGTHGASSTRIGKIYAGLREVVSAYAPDQAAVEEVFAGVNMATALKLGQARGAAICALAAAGMPVDEYAARRIKRCVTGTGRASKTQVAYMIGKLLPTANISQTESDAADALAVAITHAHDREPGR